MARILVVDDHPALLAEIGRCLRLNGHLVTSTNNGTDALSILASAQPAPELLILDMKLPGVDGHGILESLGKGGPSVIIISGDPVPKSEVETHSFVRRVLLKPFCTEKLLAAVSDALNHHNGSPSPALKDIEEECTNVQPLEPL